MATSRGAFTGHHLAECERRTLLYRCFNHDILTSSSVMMSRALWRLDLTDA